MDDKIKLPIIGISMGDPAGIGPEICVKALSEAHVYDKCKPVVIGDAEVMRQAVGFMNSEMKIHAVSKIQSAAFEYGTIDVVDLKNTDLSLLKHGEVSAMAGNAAFEAVREVINLALSKEIDATVTAPINKASIHSAGHKFSGHTEIYAHFTNTAKFAMLLADENLRVIHATTHVSLRRACDLCKKERILEVISLLNDACVQFGIPFPVIAVAGLNPHAGEDGLFGDEEINEIIPAIEEARKAGFRVEGPVPPDTMFVKAVQGKYDGCVAMYHDQGHIPFKLEGFQWDNEKQTMKSVKGVNITLGLPIIRTSVDHGTAFEIAGRGIASPDAMLVAIDYAILMSKKQKTIMLVIADDITGAAEIAGVCLSYGLKVSFGIDEIPAHEADIRIIATDSRSLTEDEAFNIHKKIAETAFRRPNAFIFKKCDSALRGYILTELSALTKAGNLHTVIIQPANPLSGRFIKNGEYYIGTEKIENTGFSHDPDFPTDESLVRNILLRRSSLQYQNFDIQVGTISRINSNGIFIPDCSTVDDLVISYNLAGEKTLLCGSAAFFQQILIKKFNCSKLNQTHKFAFPEEFLLISGSTHPGSRSFIENQKENNCRVCTLPENLCLPEFSVKDIDNWAYELVKEWNKTKRLIVTTATTNYNFPDSPKILGQRIGIVIQKFLQQTSVNEIFVTGGATTYTLLKTLNWETLIPVSELAPGVVRMKVNGTPTFLTLKPGSYSWPVTSV